MKFEKTEVWGFEHAIRGMRNPMNSWDKSDSLFIPLWFCDIEEDYELAKICHGIAPIIKENDLELMQRLIKAGSEHRKFMRQIFVSVDITAPLYWWKEADTYKVGTVANSTSTMHKLATTPITLDCFEMDDFNSGLVIEDYEEPTFVVTVNDRAGTFIDALEKLRQKYLETKDKRYWKELIRWLPESWLQTRTVTMNYENLLAICRQRKNHKLNEWSGLDNPKNQNFISWVRTLPYTQELIFIDEELKEE